MTHVKNAESYSRLVDICTGLGGTYNPGQETLQVVALIAQQKEAEKALRQVIATKNDFDAVGNERKQVFQDLRRLTASILRTLENTGMTPGRLEDARAFVHQIMGVSSPRLSVVPVADTTTVRKRSTLQLAYVSQADSFAKLLEVIANEPLYKTNEAHLSVESLNEKLKQLKSLNASVSDARTRWRYALIHRNEVMYGAETSLRQKAMAVRRYVRSLFGLQSEKYALLKTLRFTKPGK